MEKDNILIFKSEIEFDLEIFEEGEVKTGSTDPEGKGGEGK